MKKDEDLKTNIKGVETDNQSFEVGVNGITEIREVQRYSEYCMVNYYEVYKNDHHWLDIHKFNAVSYLTPG